MVKVSWQGAEPGPSLPGRTTDHFPWVTLLPSPRRPERWGPVLVAECLQFASLEVLSLSVFSHTVKYARLLKARLPCQRLESF